MKKVILALLISVCAGNYAVAQQPNVAIPFTYYYAFDPATGTTTNCTSGCIIDLPVCDSLCLWFKNNSIIGPIEMQFSTGGSIFIPKGQSNCVYFKPTGLGIDSIGFAGQNPNDFVAYYIINVVPGDCCPSNVVITGNTITGNYIQLLTESQDWIKTNGATTIPTGATVKLDAEPTNGYVELNTGFESQSGSVFIAQALDGCGPGVPMRHKKNAVVQGIAPNSSIKITGIESKLIAYPNPTSGIVNIQHSNIIKELQVFDMMGKMIMKVSTNGGILTHIDLSKAPNGIYIVKPEGVALQKIVKQ